MPDDHDGPVRSFLFGMWEGGGNVAPQLELARRLVSRGHEVRVMADDSIRGDAEAAGCRFVPWRRAPNRPDRSPGSEYLRDWEALTPLGGFARVRDRVIFGPALPYALDVRDELRRERADAAALDWMLFGAQAGAESEGVPVAGLVHTIWQVPAPGAPAPGPGFLPMPGSIGRARDAIAGRLFTRLFEAGLPALNAARRAVGVSECSTLRALLERPRRLLVMSSAAFDWPARELPTGLRYVGPQIGDPAWATPWVSPWPDEADSPPLVLSSLSTTPQGQRALLQRIVDALGELPVRGLVTTGPAVEPESVRHPSSVVVVRSAPHGAVVPRAAVVVTHAGHGTVMRALAAGVPVLCMPMGRDQPDVAARVVARGVGLRLSPRSSPRTIARAVQRLLGEPSFRLAAQELAGRIREETTADRAVTELEALARGSAVRVGSSIH